jgi:two-component system, OmpR family, sensor histidine kinase TctE
LEERVIYYDAVYRNIPIRAVALRVPVRPGSGKGAILIQVAERAKQREEFARQIMVRMMIPQGILVLLSTLTIWFGIGLGLRALTAVRREIENRSHVDLSPLDEEAAPVEVRPLVRAMNGLLERLSAALAAQQRFIADAAHQLRTPVAALKTQAELATRQAHDGELSVTLHQLHTAADHAARLVNQLLSMARAEPGSHRSVMRQPVDISVLAREATGEWVPRALTRNIDLGLLLLQRPHLRVGPPACRRRAGSLRWVPRSTICAPCVHHQDLVGIHDRRQAVRDDQRGAALAMRLSSCLDRLLGLESSAEVASSKIRMRDSSGSRARSPPAASRRRRA